MIDTRLLPDENSTAFSLKRKKPLELVRVAAYLRRTYRFTFDLPLLLSNEIEMNLY
jgi:hypothetical protein